MRNPQLDVLRTVAVLMVILSHLPAPPAGAAGVVVAVGEFFRTYGGMGVDLFFVLSGFLVSGLLFREYLSTGRARVGRFLLRRGFKIYPPFYVFLIVTVLLRLQRGDLLTRMDMLCEALFVQNYGPHVWSHTWSLAVEEHFYILLALIVLALQRYVRRDSLAAIPAIFIGTVTAVTTVRWISFMTLPYSNEALRFPTHLQIDSLFFGVLISYYVTTTPSLVERLRARRGWLFALGLACVAASQSIPGPAARYVAGHIVAYVGFGAILMAAVCTPLPVRGRRVVEAAAVHRHPLVFDLPVAHRGPGIRTHPGDQDSGPPARLLRDVSRLRLSCLHLGHHRRASHRVAGAGTARTSLRQPRGGAGGAGCQSNGVARPRPIPPPLNRSAACRLNTSHAKCSTTHWRARLPIRSRRASSCSRSAARPASRSGSSHVDDLARARRIDGFRRPTGPAGDDRLAAGLCFEQHDAESFEVPPDLPVGQGEEIALLIAGNELRIARHPAELDEIGDATLGDQTLERGTLPSFTGDGIEHVRTALADGRQRANQHVLTLAFLERARPSGSRDGFPIPDRRRASATAGRRHEMRRIHAGMHHHDLFARDLPVIDQQRSRVIGCSRSRRPPCASTFRVSRRSSRLEAASVSSSPCTNVKNGMPVHRRDRRREEPFRQALAAVDDVRPLLGDDATQPQQRCRVLRSAAPVPDAPAREIEGDALETASSAVRSNAAAVRCGRGDHVHVETGKTAIQIPQPSPAAASTRREDLRQNQNVHGASTARYSATS